MMTMMMLDDADADEIMVMMMMIMNIGSQTYIAACTMIMKMKSKKLGLFRYVGYDADGGADKGSLENQLLAASALVSATSGE